MTDTIEQAQQFLLTGDFSASLAMYNRIYNDSDSEEDRGTAAAMLSHMYGCSMTGEVNDRLAADVEKAGFVHSQYISMVGGEKDPGEILVHRVPHILSRFSLKQGHAAERVALFLSFLKELTAFLFISLPVAIAFPFYEA